MQYNILLSLVFGPILAGIACIILPDRFKNIARAAALIVSLSALAASIYVFTRKPFLWEWAGRPMLVADDLSGFIAVFTAGFAFLITIYSLGYTGEKIGRYFGYVLMTLGAALGVAFASDMILLLVFWGFLAAMLYMLVNLKGTDASAAAARKALIVIGGTDALMLFGVCVVRMITGSFAISDSLIPLDSLASYVAFFSFAAAALAKAGAVPFHSWLPDVAESADAAVTAYLPASLDKLLGIYLLARVSMNMFAVNAATGFILSLIGAVTIVFAVVVALVQHDLKRLLGYHAVSQVGYMVLGIGTGTVIGLAGGLFHMLNHAIYKSCLFLTGGAVEKRAGTTELSRLGGLSRYMPVTFAACLVAALSISGIPPFNGFVSKWMIYQGILESAAKNNPFWAVWLACAMFGSALTIASFMKLLHAVFLGRPSKEMKDVRDAGIFMSTPMVILAALCVVFGVFAASVPIAIFIGPSVGAVISYLGVWDPKLATALILIALGLGSLSYLLLKPGTFRTVGVFIGGEDASGLDRVTGTEFYDTVKDLRGMSRFYKKEASGSFDIYYILGRMLKPFTDILRRLHNGILPTYMVWGLIGMSVMFFIMFARHQ